MQKFRFIFLFIVFSLNAHDSEDYLHQFIDAFAKEMKNELNVRFQGKELQIHDKVEGIKLNFEVYRRATLEEARALQISIISRFVQAINNNQDVRPCLVEHPFSHKRVGNSISFNGPFGENFDGTVTYLFSFPNASASSENKLFYSAADPFTEKLVRLLEEPYEVALKKTQASPLKDPASHQTTELEEVSDQVFNSVATELSQKNGLYLKAIGGKLTNGIEEIGAKFITFQPATVEKARKLEWLAIEALIHAVNKEPRLRPYLKPFPFPINQLKVCIEFRKNKKTDWGYDTYTDGSVDHVQIENSLISYYQRQRKTGRILYLPQLFAEETIQQAQEILGIVKK